MKNHFTFLQSPELTALKYAVDLMPGLLQVDLIMKDDLKNELSVFRLKHTEEDVQQIEMEKNQLEGSIALLHQLKNLSWYKNSDLPYYDKPKQRIKNDLFSELDNNVLLIPIKNILELPELIYVFLFRKNASELGPVAAHNVLDTSHKQILGRLIYNSLKGNLKSIIENRKVMLQYNNMLSNLIKSKDQELDHQKEISKELNDHLNNILFTHLDELKTKEEVIYLSEKTKLKLYPHLSNPVYLKDQLNKALNFARTFHFLKPGEQIELLPEYFMDLSDAINTKTKDTQNKSDIYSSHTKTYQFLQSLEDAANRTLHKGNKLTSMNVGQELEQAVTAAAISDKLKNHSYKIHLLLQQYPEKWPIIRNQFRPVINIIEKQSRKKIAS